MIPVFQLERFEDITIVDNSRHSNRCIWKEESRCDIGGGVLFTFTFSVVLDVAICRLDVVGV